MSNALASNQARHVIILSSILSVRMLGLFMILPVFSAYAMHLAGATPTMIGVTLGIYGLTQSCFQIPFGILSDYVGRKRVIFFGLILLLIGSILAAFSHSIYTLCIARALQGTGAIGSTILALLSDLTRNESRTKAMAFLGLSIGFAFIIAMITGPVIHQYFALSGIFITTAMLALIAMVLLLLIPTPPKPLKTSEKIAEKLLAVLGNAELMRLNISVFFLHAILTALFFAIPILFIHHLHLSNHDQVCLYLVVLISAFLFALPLIIFAEKKRKMKMVFLNAILSIFLVSTLLAIFYHHFWITAFLLFIFFTAFTLLEAILPSYVSKIAPIQNKGASMGVYSSSQFFGIFVGGSLGGFIYAYTSLNDIFVLCACFAIIWFGVAMMLHEPPYLSTLLFRFYAPIANYQHLWNTDGIAEVSVVPAENLLYLKIDKEKISEPVLRKLIEASNLSGNSSLIGDENHGKRY